jgi:hypothetical protein
MTNYCLHLNIDKTVCMYFSIDSSQRYVLVNGENLKVGSNFKYLGVISDSNLTFKIHVKKVVKTVMFGLSNFRFIRPFLPLEADKLYMHAMIFSHLRYCLTGWSQSGATILKPIDSL